MIENAELPGHWNRHLKQTPLLDWMLKRESSAEGRHVDQTCVFNPLKVRSFPAVNAYRQPKFQALANSLRSAGVAHFAWAAR